jgi:hypothetical protein
VLVLQQLWAEQPDKAAATPMPYSNRLRAFHPQPALSTDICFYRLLLLCFAVSVLQQLWAEHPDKAAATPMPYSNPAHLAALLAADPYFEVDCKGMIDASRAGSSSSSSAGSSSSSSAAAAAAAAVAEVKLLVGNISELTGMVGNARQ